MVEVYDQLWQEAVGRGKLREVQFILRCHVHWSFVDGLSHVEDQCEAGIWPEQVQPAFAIEDEEIRLVDQREGGVIWDGCRAEVVVVLEAGHGADEGVRHHGGILVDAEDSRKRCVVAWFSDGMGYSSVC